QSQIPAHAELSWILNNYVTMGELSRMTQFKDKTSRSGVKGQVVGLFDYPVLMAADILLYDADEVPVGEDQVQHVELTRDIARRFNNRYGRVFKLPKPTLQKVGARIMNLQDPSKKMSASDSDTSGVIFLSDSATVIGRKITKAVTDSGKDIRISQDKPAISNLLQIFSLISDRSISSLETQYESSGYQQFKADLADEVAGAIEPLQKQHDRLMSDRAKILRVIAGGRKEASALAAKKLAQVKKKLGLVSE
ncbi:tryptophan--tRNA ligase, partial [Candidatus Microgenomates bacterium]|nr:tryptophan--tRNA ligase [Candidatus Microgenomates bacterium]